MHLVASLLYASPAWWGLTNEADWTRLDRFGNRLKRLEYIPGNALNINGLEAQGEKRPFRTTEANPVHVLHDLCPQKVKWT